MEYYIKLSFYLHEGDKEKTCTVSFDNELISNDIKVSSKNVLDTNDFTFKVDKDPNFYSLDISVKQDDKESIVALKNIFLSLDNKNWIMIIHRHSLRSCLWFTLDSRGIKTDFNLDQTNRNDFVNSNGHQIISTTAPDDFPYFYGFHEANPAIFWHDAEISFEIELANNQLWEARYSYGDWGNFIEKIRRISSETEEQLALKGPNNKSQFIKQLEDYYNLMKHLYEK